MQRSAARTALSHIPPGLRQVAAIVAIGSLGTAGLVVAEGGAPRGAASVAVSQAAPNPSSPPAHAAPAPAGDRVPSVAKLTPRVPRATPGRTAGRPAPRPVVRQPARLVRWLPSGTGMWVYEWKKSARGQARRLVWQAQDNGLTTLFIRTGSTHDGYTGDPLLGALLPATRGTNVHVVTWDFPELKNPMADARRLARTAWYNRNLRSWPHVAAVAPDIETGSEGTHSTPARVQAYLTTLRRLLPRDVAILATVPWPSSARRGHYPYAIVARTSDALLPMAYWYNNSPQSVTATSVSYLRRFGRPVQPVGQAYDGHGEWRWLPHNNLRAQVPAFLATARHLGVDAVSMWSWQSATADSWRALSAGRRLFPVGR